MSLLTELGNLFSAGFYKDFAPTVLEIANVSPFLPPIPRAQTRDVIALREQFDTPA
jgi:hypothetical protein